MVILIYRRSWIPYMSLICGILLVFSPLIFPDVTMNVPMVIIFGFIGILLGIYGIIKQKEQKEEVARKVRNFKAEFNSRLRDFQKREYSSAIRAFNGLLLVEGITSELECTLYSLLARSYYLEGNWPHANVMSQKLFEKGLKISGCRLQYEDYILRIECLLLAKDVETAKETLNRAKRRFEAKPELEQLEVKIKLLETLANSNEKL